jgi:tetratricopeptide (TPR) repeat protein
MIRFSIRRSANLLLAIAVALSFPQSSRAENKFLKEGMAEYAIGNYSDASGHFGGALATDFNNSVLHYYLGSCYVHMKQKEAAIREFRIAYALDPDKEVGQYSKQALATYGLDSAGAVVEPKKLEWHVKDTSTSTAPPATPKLSALEQQVEDLKNLRTEQSRLSSIDAGKQGDRLVERTKNDILDSMRYTTRRGTVVQPTQLNSDGTHQVDYLKHLYDSQRTGYLDIGAKQSSEIQRSAEFLQEQMNEQAKAGKVHMSTSGTNLYVRNYEMTPPEPKPAIKPSPIHLAK